MMIALDGARNDQALDTVVDAYVAECHYKLSRERNHNVLTALVEAADLIRLMAKQKASGRLEMFIKDGVVLTVTAPDTRRLPSPTKAAHVVKTEY